MSGYFKKDIEMNPPKVSIITVSYNVVNTIENTILSVINQTYPNIEYIIIDGGSTDGTVDIIKKYERKIAYWITESDKGIYDAMNKGIMKATGDWINFMNSGDNLLDETVIEKFVSLYDKNVDIVYGDTKYNIAKIGVSFIQKPKPIESVKLDFCHQSTFIKSKLMKDTLYDTTFKIKSDYKFFLQSYQNNKLFQYIPITIAVFDYDTGVSSNFRINRHEQARIDGIEQKTSWKVKYIIDYIIWKFRYCIKSVLPPNILKKYYLKKNH